MALARKRTSASGSTAIELPRKSAMQKARAAAIYDALLKRYPDAHCELEHANSLQLLIATILSAQALDSQVNKVTPELFKAFPTAADFARSTPANIEPFISRIGLFRNKAKSIHGAATMIVRDFAGNVPNNMSDLLKLPGVARKTANVVLGNAFNKAEGVVVDTHVQRVAGPKRLGLTRQTDPKKIERDLMALFPPDRWCMLAHLLIFHGRRACKARGESCSIDPVCRDFCVNSKSKKRSSNAPAKNSSRRPSRRFTASRDG